MDILLVFNKQEAALSRLIDETLAAMPTGSPEEELTVDEASNCAATLLRMRKRKYELVVVGASLAADGQNNVSKDGGLELCRELRKRWDMPIILLVPQVTAAAVAQCNSVVAPAPIPLDDAMAVVSLVPDILRKASRRSLSLHINVIVDAGGWSYDMKGEGFDYNAAGKLNVPRSASMCWTDFHPSPDHWYIDFARIGNSIKTCLCEENRHFDQDRIMGLQKADRQRPGVAVDTRLVFLVPEDQYRLIVEAIFDPDPGRPVPWMVNAQLLRHVRYGGVSQRGPLFQSSSSELRALLVCADTNGLFRDDNIPGGKLELAKLTHLNKECQSVRRALCRPDDVTGRVWFSDLNITQLGGTEGLPATRPELMRQLERGPWDLIHYAGHSCFYGFEGARNAQSGYIFVGEPGVPEGIRFNELAPFFRDAGLLYLSSCESGNSSFFVEASAAGVSTMMGFRWKVDDWAARLQAKIFYRQLLHSLSVGTAFRDTRRALFQQFEGDRLKNIWASSMLVTSQP
jgi:hypothetical protein